jgi:signal transduction histidine kinase
LTGARLLWPRSLAGQIILIVAGALFLAQAINFAILYRERQRQLLIVTTAPAVARIVDSLERRYVGGAPFQERVRFTTVPPVLSGRPREDVAVRAEAMLEDLGFRPARILATEDDRALVPRRWRRIHERLHPDTVGRQRRLQLAVEYRPGLWITVQSRIGAAPPRMLGWLIGQTLILYVIVLLPLLGVGRLLARPLKELTQAARDFGRTGNAEPVVERGPGDVRDLTSAFNAMRARLLAMLEEKDRMLGAIGHDLRTPLASLRVRTESVEDEGERTRMSATIEEMSRMLDDILALARGGRSQEPEQRVDVAALVDAVVEDFIELGEPVTLIEAPRAVVSIRPHLIRRAVRNLIENALKYGERAEVAVLQGQDGVRIRVRDAGPGIASDRIEDMLQPFTRMESSRNRDTGGAGLGLALVRAIMTEQGGSLELSNRREGGLDATLFLPITEQ